VSDFEPQPHSWPRQHFDRFRAQAMANVHPPGPGGAIRMAVRRQRVRTVTAAVVAAAVVGGFTGYLTRGIGGDGRVVTDGPTASADQRSPSGTPDATPSATPSAPPRTAPPTSTSPTRPAGPTVDLKVTGPASFTLTPDTGENVYRGLLTITVRNLSSTSPHDSEWVRVTLPLNVKTEPGPESPVQMCLGTYNPPDAPPGAITWGCNPTAKTGPLGTLTWKIPIRVDIAPGSTAQTIQGFQIDVRPMLRGNEIDSRPQDNTLKTALVLPAV